jgi:hypothetical protein
VTAAGRCPDPGERAREIAFGRRILPYGLPLLDTGPPAGQPAGDVTTWAGIAAAVGLVSARLGGLRIGHGDLAPDIPPAAVLAALLMITAAIVRAELGTEDGAHVLRALGLLAAAEGAEPAAA